MESALLSAEHACCRSVSAELGIRRWEELASALTANTGILLSMQRPIQKDAGHCCAERANRMPSVCRWNGYTSFLTTGAGSWGEPNDSCGSPDSYLYTNGGEPADSQAIHSLLQMLKICQEV